MFSLASDNEHNTGKSVIGELPNGHDGFEVHVRRDSESNLIPCTDAPVDMRLAASFIDISGARKAVHLDGDMFGRAATLQLAEEGTHLARIARKLVDATTDAADKRIVSDRWRRSLSGPDPAFSVT